MNDAAGRIRTLGYFVPRLGLRSAVRRRLHPTTVVSRLARYSYSVWLRHFWSATSRGLVDRSPETLIEIGPGPTLGVGLAAMLSGTDRISAYDVATLIEPTRDQAILHELEELFRERATIPGGSEFPSLRPEIDMTASVDAAWPDGTFDDDIVLQRRDRISAALKGQDSGVIEYRGGVPAERLNAERPARSAQWVLSQAVMEYVPDIDAAYRAMWEVMSPGGIMTHQIDLSSHDTASEWDGHWRYSPTTWRLIQAARTGSLNRLPLSAHLRSIRNQGFKVLASQPVTKAPSATQRSRHQAGFTDEDLETSGVFLIATRPA